MDSMSNEMYYRGLTVSQDLSSKKYVVNLDGHITKSGSYDFIKCCIDVQLDPAVSRGFKSSEGKNPFFQID